MDGDFCELLRCCCECGLCIGLCCLCCKDNDSNQRRDPYYANGPNVTVTTSQPGPQPAYPPGMAPPGGYGGGHHYPPSMPMPQPQPGFYPPPMGYPPNSGAPYAPPGGPPYHPGPVPGGYPPAGYPPAGPGYQSQPPPYDVAVSMPPAQPYPPQPEAYVKQAPYNPHYQN